MEGGRKRKGMSLGEATREACWAELCDAGCAEQREREARVRRRGSLSRMRNAFLLWGECWRGREVEYERMI